MTAHIPAQTGSGKQVPAQPAKGVALLDKLIAGGATVGVIGLGYVGLPLAVTAAVRGANVIGFEVDPKKIELLDAGTTYIEAVSRDALDGVAGKTFSWTMDFRQLASCDVIVICVPTPLSAHREPDLSYVENTARDISRYMTDGTLVVLESTTFPGTTDDVMTPILEEGGLKAGEDFFVAFSPEREDPGNKSFHTATIPKIVAGDGPMAGQLAQVFYEGVVDKVVPVSSTRTAEAVKVTENIFRAVNIALVNELKVIYDAMGIDVWEVIDGAATKPFGFMPFYPGPGLGGHCIPIDPFYLTWKAREYELTTRFIELAGEINVNMPKYVIGRMRDVIDTVHGKGLRGSRVLIVGIAYKKNVSDMRESPSMRIMELLHEVGVEVDFLDPLVPVVPKMRAYPQFLNKASIAAADVAKGGYDAIMIATDHDDVDYAALTELGVPLIDTRNAFARRGLSMEHVTKA